MTAVTPRRTSSLYAALWNQDQVRWASHCFPIEKAGKQDLMHMIVRPAINKDIKNRKAMRGTLHMQRVLT